jgi:ADP-heptose:LPS heptosyltransferase
MNNLFAAHLLSLFRRLGSTHHIALARAVKCPAVVIYGGRETPELTGYPCNINLTQTPPCSPCWQRSRCDHSRICMESLSAEDATTALKTLLSRLVGPLPIAIADLE